MDRADLDHLEALHRAATPGPWEADLDGNRNGEPLLYGATRDWWIATLHPQCLGSLEELRRADAALIAAARNALAAELAERMRRIREREEQR